MSLFYSDLFVIIFLKVVKFNFLISDKCRKNILFDYNCPATKYIQSGFTFVQSLIDIKFIEVSKFCINLLWKAKGKRMKYVHTHSEMVQFR